MSIIEAKERLRIEGLWTMLALPGEPGSSCRSPFREDEHPSFWVSPDGCRFFDHGTGDTGDAIDFLQRATRLTKSAACKKFIELAAGLPVPTTASHLPFVPPHTREPKKELDRRVPPTLPNFWLDRMIRLTYKHRPLRDLAKLRNLGFEGVRLAYERGLVQFYTQHYRVGEVVGYYEYIDWDEIETWVITDSRRVNAQMRRLDGRPWDRLKGQPKSWTWPGSWAKWPIGTQEAQPFPLIVLVEGGPDLLAAHHFAELAGAENEVGVVGMMGAGMPIHHEALPLFKGKRVRIIPDADDPGRKAAEKWGAQLREAGAVVDAFDLGGLRTASDAPIKDLNDCCLIHPDDAAALEGLFIL